MMMKYGAALTALTQYVCYVRNMRRRSMKVSSVRNLSGCYSTWISFFQPNMPFATLVSTWLESAKCL